MNIKDQIRAEIERYNAGAQSAYNPHDEYADFYYGKVIACEDLLDFLATLPEQPVEGLEEEERKYMSERWKLGCTPITPVCLPNFTTDDLKECAEFFYRLGLNNKK